MANDLTDNPLVVDTAAVVYLGPHSIAKLRWIGATTAGHGCILKDGDDTTAKWEAVATGANFTERDDFPTANRLHFKTSINVTTIASGRLYIYLARD